MKEHSLDRSAEGFIRFFAKAMPLVHVAPDAPGLQHLEHTKQEEPIIASGMCSATTLHQQQPD
jgi:hypothetical protein